MTPQLLPDVSLLHVAAAGALNPIAIAVSYLLGRKADQFPKLIIAGFAGAAAAALTLYLAAMIGIPGADNLSRAGAGVFTVSLVAGIFYAWVGYKTRDLNNR